MDPRLRVLLEGISFGEAPRWRDGWLYLSDMHADRVVRVSPSGELDIVAEFEGPVSGLGWLPDGRLLVVSMIDRRVLRQEADGRIVLHADIADIATGPANDMVVAADGTAYVGNFGFELFPVMGTPRTAVIARVTPDGGVAIAAEEFWFPNGMVITPDEKTLIVAESGAKLLTATDIADDGSLVNRRLWGSMAEDQLPDGICLDVEGAIWIASPPSREVVRMTQGGSVIDRMSTGQEAIACMLGGEDGRTLFIMTAEGRDPQWCRQNKTARILATTVDVPGAGRP